MKSQRVSLGRSLFYSRDSGGKHDQTPAEYVAWAKREAEKLGLKFHGTADGIGRMIKSGQPFAGDLFFDSSVCGNLMSRPALDALRETIRRDPSVSHLFIPRRDRLARPDDPLDGVRLERELRDQGLTLVFMNLVLAPLRRGQRQDIGESIAAVIDYHQSGAFREELAEKMIYAQIQLARQGFSTGGRAPYGFRRNLVRDDGTVVRLLSDGEIIRQAGHHVVWLPGPREELAVIRRILEMLVTMPASRVARTLNEEGVPSPDFGRKRKDGGIPHQVSGRWHQPTITNIARHPVIRAISQYGRRSMGDQRRMTPEGPRFVADSEIREDGKPKVVRNEDQGTVIAKAHCEPLIPVDQAERLIAILDKRAGTQRGKPRSRCPDKNPLGGRIFDMNCTWPMYRIPYQESFRYTCGLYQQSQPRQCSHNHVDGVVATRFALAAIRQRLLDPGMRNRLEEKLRKLAAGNQTSHMDRTRTCKQEDLLKVQSQLAVVKRNLALAETPEESKAIREVFVDLTAREAQIANEISKLPAANQSTSQGRNRFDEAMELTKKLPMLAEDSKNLGSIGQLFSSLNLQMFLRFQPVQKAKRIENKLAGGILTIGETPPPIEKYNGPTGRGAIQESKRSQNPEGEMPSGSVSQIDSDRRRKSLGNVNRADRI